MHFVHQSYGKSRVRVLRVARHSDRHEVREIRVKVSLEGDFDRAYTHADNAMVVPTDTMKNLVQVLAHQHPETENEPFIHAVAECFLTRYDQVAEAHVELEEVLWQRMHIQGSPQPHSFVRANQYAPVARIRMSRGGWEATSGIRDFSIMKTTESGFADFPRDEFTTLPETTDRVLATCLQATWSYARPPAAYAAVTQTVCGVLQEVFATTYSVSVQDSLWRMGSAALEAVPELDSITLSMPNLHYHALDLSSFGIETDNQLFLPTDEPHGHIEATLRRA